MSRLLVAQRALTVPGWVKDEFSRKAQSIPSLDLRFADNKSLVDAVTGASLVTFTRASTGTFVGSDGVLRSAVTNLLLQSEDFSTTWIKDSNAVVTTNVATAPNGSVTADKFAVGTSTFPQIAQAATSTVSLTHSFSVYIKAAGLNFIQLRVRNAGASTNYFRAVFNLSTGEVTSAITNGTGVIVSATTVNAGDGWWRCTLTGIADTTGTSIQPLAILATDATGTLATSSNSAATDGVLLWGAQLEQSATVGEYIPTTSTINSAPRFDHNPTTGESLGLLVEEARTNLQVRSEEFDNTGTWSRTGLSTVTANSSVAPDGLTTADTLVEDASTGNHRVFATTSSLAASTSYSLSVYVKASTRTIVRVEVRDSVGAFAAQDFNLTTQAIISAGSGTGAISALGNGWFRCTVTGTTSVLGGVGVVLIYSMQVAGNATYTGTNGTSAILLWGAQLEAGAFPTSYIPTTTATVTRAADVATISNANLLPWFTSFNEYTFYAELRGEPPKGPGGIIMEGLVSGALGGATLALNNTATRFRSQQRTGPSRFDAGNNNGSLLNNTINRVALGASALGSQSGENGLLPTTASVPAQADWDSGSALSLGKRSSNSTVFLNGCIARFAYWPTHPGNEVLQQISQP